MERFISNFAFFIRESRAQRSKKTNIFPFIYPPIYFTVYILYLINRISQIQETHIKLHSSLLQRRGFSLLVVHSLFQPGGPFSPSDHYTIEVTTRLFTIKTEGRRGSLRKEEIKSIDFPRSRFSFHSRIHRKIGCIAGNVLYHFNFILSSSREMAGPLSRFQWI